MEGFPGTKKPSFIGASEKKKLRREVGGWVRRTHCCSYLGMMQQRKGTHSTL